MKFSLSTRKPNAWQSAWDWLSSATGAVILLALTAVVSIIGTVLPRIDFYGSLPFKLLLALLGLSLFACSYKRWTLAARGKLNLYLWSSFAAHLSVLIIYLGVIYGGTAGFSSNVSIEKGKAYFEPRGDFSVRLNDFNAKFDENGRPLKYSSDLSVIQDGKEVLRKTISVNDPLIYMGIKFYQSSYGLLGELEIAGPGGRRSVIPISKGNPAFYPPAGPLFVVEELLPDIQALHGVPAANYEPTAPVAYLLAFENDDNAQPIGWLVQGKTQRWGNYSLKLTGVTEYTGLQVKQDPGLAIVYLGFLLLTVGVGMMLYVKR